MRNEERSGLRSVARAMEALELIAENGELGVSELGRRLDVHKATASRLIATLAEPGLVERDPTSGKFRLGFGLIRLAGAAMAGLDLVRTAHPILEELADRIRETVNLGVLSGDSVVYVDQVAGARSIVAISWVGRRTPLHCTSNGKVLLAHMDAKERDRGGARSPGRRQGDRGARRVGPRVPHACDGPASDRPDHDRRRHRHLSAAGVGRSSRPSSLIRTRWYWRTCRTPRSPRG